jgi:histidinol-phosphate aminotransferase
MGIPVEKIVKLASNENPLGMSPKARKAVEAALAGIERYPDQFDLIAAIAERHGVAQEQVVLGNGSNDVLDLAARVFLAPGRSAVFSKACLRRLSAGHDVRRRRMHRRAGEELRPRPGRHAGGDSSRHACGLDRQPQQSDRQLPAAGRGARLHREDSAACCVVLDEAYTEYLAPADRADTVAWIKDFPNLLVVRTFSKIYGLAGLRVGYGVGRSRGDRPAEPRAPALQREQPGPGGALAALDDHAFLAASYESNRRGMEQIIAGLKRLGLEHIPSHGNFVTFEVADAAAVNGKLLKQGVIVRPIGGYGMPKHLRVTIGLEAENRRFLDALEKSL